LDGWLWWTIKSEILSQRKTSAQKKHFTPQAKLGHTSSGDYKLPGYHTYTLHSKIFFGKHQYLNSFSKNFENQTPAQVSRQNF
jgi:hypothetical protein